MAMTVQNSLEASIKNLDAKISKLSTIANKFEEILVKYQGMTKDILEASEKIADNAGFIKAMLYTEALEKLSRLEKFLWFVLCAHYRKQGKELSEAQYRVILAQVYTLSDSGLLALAEKIIGPQ